MNKHHKAIQDATQVTWDQERTQRARDGIVLKKKKHKQKQIIASAISLASLGALLFYFGMTQTTQPSPNLAQKSVPSIQFADGSVAFPNGPHTLIVQHSSTERIVLDLQQGTSQFEVAPNPNRRFIVRAGNVHVTVIGTKFSVDRSPDDQVRVQVTQGRVRVDATNGVWFLNAGELGTFPGQAIQAKAPKEPPPTQEPPPPPNVTPRPPKPQNVVRRIQPRPEVRPKAKPKLAITPKTWEQLASKGNFKEAAQRLELVSPSALNSANSLMRAAEVMRFAGQPRRSIKFLESIETRYPNDAQAPMALFLRARTLLTSKPCLAAQLFAKIQHTKLAEDALAREVEALGRCGNLQRANIRAQVYKTRYPHGHHRGTVERWSKGQPQEHP